MKPHDKIRHAHELIQLAATLLDEAASHYEADYNARIASLASDGTKDGYDWETHDLVHEVARNTRSQASQLLFKLGRAEGFGTDNELEALANLANRLAS